MTKFSGSQQSQLAQIGAFLREKREQQGKSLQDIAVSTYIRPQLLSGIETGDPDLLPEPVFVQGFIRRYAETLGLKGVELSQQFTVDSIPSTPRPAKASEPEDSSTTRLTRLTSKLTPRQPGANTALTPVAPMPAANPTYDSATVDEVPVFAADDRAPADDRVLADDRAPADNRAPADDLNIFDFTGDSDAVFSESGLSRSDASGLAENGSTQNGLTENTSAENASANSGLGQLPVFERANAELEASVSEPSENESLPFVSDLPLAKKTSTSRELTTSPISYTSSSPLSSETSHVDTPNLKPFAIGAVIIAALTAGIVVLANVLGGDRSPTVANSADSIESVEPTEAESALPTLPAPEPEPAPPVSDAPLFLEVEVTAPAWTTVVADGGERLFEGTLNPGDREVWEAQNSINVFSGNPGGLKISQNGQPAEPLGENGIPSGKDYSVQ
ncbi:MAG: helix-turn-helix domain-containing protein [Phormidesmis sp.]